MKNKDNVTVAKLVNTLKQDGKSYAYICGILEALIDGHITYGHNGNKSFEEVYDLQYQINTTMEGHEKEMIKERYATAN